MVAGQRLTVVLAAMFFFCLLVRYNKVRPSFRSEVAMVAFVAILSVQAATAGTIHAVTAIGFLIRLFIGYAAIRLVPAFPGVYVRVLFWISLLSWPFYAMNLLSHGLLAQWSLPLAGMIGVEDGTHILVHNFSFNQYRNSSFFWEPGALSAYLLLAVMFLGLERQRYDRRRYYVIAGVLSVTVITTMSTAGMLLLPVCLWGVSLVQRLALPRRGIVVLGGLLLLIACYAALYRLGTVGEKVRHQYASAFYREGNWELTRFGSLLSDLEYITLRPYFGWGLHSDTRYFLHGGETLEGQGNGLSDFAAKFGLLGLGTYLLSAGAGIYRLTQRSAAKSALFVAFLVVVLNGEPLLNYPLYLGLMFLAPDPPGRAAAARGMVGGS